MCTLRIIGRGRPRKTRLSARVASLAPLFRSRRSRGSVSGWLTSRASLYRELLLEQPKTDTDESIRERTYQSISLKRKVEGAVTVDGAVPLSPSLPPASASCASRRANKQERVRTGCCIASPIATFRDAEIRLLGVHKAPSASSR